VRILGGYFVPYIHCYELRESELYTRGATRNELRPSQTQVLASTLYLRRGDSLIFKQRVLLPHFVLMMLQTFSSHFAIHQSLLLEIRRIFTLSNTSSRLRPLQTPICQVRCRGACFHLISKREGFSPSCIV